MTVSAFPEFIYENLYCKGEVPPAALQLIFSLSPILALSATLTDEIVGTGTGFSDNDTAET